MRIAQSLIDEMVAHAREDLPNECCGMVGGRGDVAMSVYRAENEFASPLRFGVASKDLFRITQKEMPEREEELVAIYHSHTHTEAFPSQTDIRLAYYPDSAYVIVSLADQAKPSLRAFRIVDGEVAEMEVAVR